MKTVFTCRHWLIQREDKVNCKGKGLMTTFWCEPRPAAESDLPNGSSTSLELEPRTSTVAREMTFDDNLGRLIDWNVAVLERLLVDVVAHREQQTRTLDMRGSGKRLASQLNLWNDLSEAISLSDPSYNFNRSSKSAQIDLIVTAQLRLLVTSIAKLCQNNPFHNFEHGTYMSMFAMKLINGVLVHETSRNGLSSSLTNGSSATILDPLSRFSIVFAALIQDIDHPGVSIQQARHDDGVGMANKRTAEMAWQLLMDEKCSELRHCICSCPADHALFCQIVMNEMTVPEEPDVDIQSMRVSRWMKSSSTRELRLSQSGYDDSKRRKTLVTELILQASSASYMMQHFAVYSKWCTRLLAEVCASSKSDGSARNLLESWYEQEVLFFDTCVIPLAQKLKECGAFGAVSDAVLDYAQENRTAWATTGRDIVKEAAMQLAD
jgi:hypothetical protein